jgi:hypothetical protein
MVKPVASNVNTDAFAAARSQLIERIANQHAIAAHPI